MTMTASTSATARPAEDAATVEEPPRSRKKLAVIAVVVLALAGAGWYFFLRPSGSHEPVPGEILTIEPTQINLAGGHYLKIGLALQLTEGAEEADGSKALDATIDMFSGLSVEEVSVAKKRAKLKEELVAELVERYEGDVMGVYFTEYVTQ
jgi:flagellar FliL protein